MNRVLVLSVFCAVTAFGLIGIFQVLAAIQTAVPGTVVSPSLVMGLMLMVATMSCSTTLAILRRF